ncbi:T9SS type A sorting domain-containing protein [bacterium]|nr:T9SS type A sorting domain-containing protein [bacterium]
MKILLSVILLISAFSVYAQNVVIVIIDGARYSETFGDPERTFVPNMAEIAEEGTICDEFYNDQYTFTSRAIPALWCGTWTDVRDTTYNGQNTQYTTMPTIFEYYRQQLEGEPEDCIYVLKYLTSLWLPSFHDDYGPWYWPMFVSEGRDDSDVMDNALRIIDEHHPALLWVYLADVDHAGHQGDWDDYTHKIQIADSLVGVLWDTIQSDPIYQDNTTLLVTNDHGRHDDQHGGFSGHGDDCDGCRHIMFLAAGPDIREGEITRYYRTIPDFAVTACEIFSLDPEEGTGEVMEEIFKEEEENEVTTEISTLPSSVSLNAFPNPFNNTCHINFELQHENQIKVALYDLQGREIESIVNQSLSAGKHTYTLNADHLTTGIYFIAIKAGNDVEQQKVMLLR